ncbi:hypothetical protein M0Q50_10110 [bacterium]|jgi:hypothetical protein|nr:hypothetical protein [bacterium]
MEQLILVFYINIDNMSTQRAMEYLQDIQENVKNKPEGSIQYIIPVKDQETKIECINPKIVTEEQYNEILEKLNSIEYLSSLPEEIKMIKIKLGTL